LIEPTSITRYSFSTQRRRDAEISAEKTTP
jgi:hypothetical protein